MLSLLCLKDVYSPLVDVNLGVDERASRRSDQASPECEEAHCVNGDNETDTPYQPIAINMGPRA